MDGYWVSYYVDGYWAYQSGYWAWAPGYWAWAPGYWEWVPGYWEWVPGYWQWIPGQYVWIADTTPPSTSISASPASPKGGDTITVSWTASDAESGLSSVAVTESDNGVTSTLSTASSGSAAVTASWGHSYTFTVNATDADGNRATSLAAVTAQPAPTVTGLTTTPSASSVTVGATLSFTVRAAMSDGTTQDVTGQSQFSVTPAGALAFNGATATAVQAGSATVTAAYSGQQASTTVTVSAPALLTVASPADGASLSGQVRVTASVTSLPAGMSSVVFSAGGNVVASGSSPDWSGVWDTTATVAGSYTMTAAGKDAAGNTVLTGSNSINVTVTPQGWITSPADGATITGATTLTGRTNYPLSDGQFILTMNGQSTALGNASIGSDGHTATLQWSPPVASGSGTLQMVSHDTSGGVHYSASVPATLDTVVRPVVTAANPIFNLGAHFLIDYKGLTGVSKIEIYADGIKVKEIPGPNTEAVGAEVVWRPYTHLSWKDHVMQNSWPDTSGDFTRNEPNSFGPHSVYLVFTTPVGTVQSDPVTVTQLPYLAKPVGSNDILKTLFDQDPNSGQITDYIGVYCNSNTHTPIDCPWGTERPPDPRAYDNHTGIDWGSAPLTPIHPARTGKVVAITVYSLNYMEPDYAKDPQPCGNSLEIDHGQGDDSLGAFTFNCSTRYCHTTYQSIPDSITIGSQVVVTDIIATVGNTGQSDGPHLHMTTLLNGSAVDPYYRGLLDRF